MPDYYSIGAIKRLLDERGIYLTKQRGQHFLVDKNTLNIIIESAKINQDDTVIEIGPGIGSLSHILINKCKKLILIEYDKKLAELITELSSEKENVEVHHADFLKIDFSDLIKNEKVKICANIPYNITSKIIEKLIDNRENIISFTLTMQKEVAERIVANPGSKTFGSISVFCQTFTNPVLCKIIPKTVFFPVPNVDSAVVRFDIVNNKYKINDEKLFFNIVHSIFTSRRKTLKNSLTMSKFVSFTKEQIEKMFSITKLDGSIRGDTLQIEQIALISNVFAEIIEK